MYTILFQGQKRDRTYIYYADSADVMQWLYDMAAKYKSKIQRLSITEGRFPSLTVFMHYHVLGVDCRSQMCDNLARIVRE